MQKVSSKIKHLKVPILSLLYIRNCQCLFSSKGGSLEHQFELLDFCSSTLHHNNKLKISNTRKAIEPLVNNSCHILKFKLHSD